MSRVPGLRRILPWSAAMLVLGAVGGLAWLWLADPAEWEVTARGIILTEEAARGQFAVVVTFIIVGAALSVGWGLVAGRALRELGWVLVPVFAAAAGLAGVIAWRLGAALGPSDPRETGNPSLGDRLPAQLDIDAVAPFLVWPMFALIGLLLAAWLDRSDEDADDLTADAA
ncbi:hypothetical protein [Aeromicrobium sp.]|uniref:hypothetical protein n=1 Tax=Aeromicrobium sp. TaxID=1871063 RepID=UPI003C686474